MTKWEREDSKRNRKWIIVSLTINWNNKYFKKKINEKKFCNKNKLKLVPENTTDGICSFHCSVNHSSNNIIMKNTVKKKCLNDAIG